MCIEGQDSFIMQAQIMHLYSCIISTIYYFQNEQYKYYVSIEYIYHKIFFYHTNFEFSTLNTYSIDT